MPNTKQPLPTTSVGDICALVIADMEERRRMGIAKFGTPLQPHNGRDARRDLYQELLDAVFYERQDLEERRLEREQVADADIIICGLLVEIEGGDTFDRDMVARWIDATRETILAIDPSE